MRAVPARLYGHVHYDMAFKLLRYTVMVLTDYEREEEKKRPGITRTKEFRYPPIIPIVYYEGTSQWTAVRHFKERVYLNEVLGKYIPDFEYLVVPIASYTNGELIEKKDELSLIMLINKLRNSGDFKTLKEIPAEYFEELSEKTPQYLLELLSELGTAPEELCRTIQETTDLEKLKSWLKMSAKAENIGQFREKAGI